MKNRLHILILILIAFVGCDNQKTKTTSTIKRVNGSESKTKNKNIYKEGELIQDSTIYHSAAASYQIIRNKPDTLIYKDHKVAVYTHFNKFKTDYISKRKNKTISIDSVKVFEPINASIVSPHKQNAFDVDNVESYNIGKFVRIRDINNDGKLDIDLYNLQISKMNNILYDVFLRNNDEFKYSEELSIRNLKYDSISYTYTSQYYDDETGKTYLTNRYNYLNDSLILIEVEQQRYIKKKNAYLKKKTNLITGEIISEEIRHER